MKKALKAILALSIIYGLFVFIEGNFNPWEWAKWIKVVAVVSVVVYFLKDDGKNDLSVQGLKYDIDRLKEHINFD